MSISDVRFKSNPRVAGFMGSRNLNTSDLLDAWTNEYILQLSCIGGKSNEKPNPTTTCRTVLAIHGQESQS